jgi:2-methylisocitrate lyase-like PEP mutase family enzyme
MITQMPTQTEKARTFRALHERAHAFIIPNPWDAGSAKLLTHLGFEALATTSAGYSFSAGRPDNTTPRQEMLLHCAAVVNATNLPVSGDLENGFGDSPETVAETIRLAAAAGLAGCSIEDSTGHTGRPVYEFEHSVDRVRAAVTAARALPFPFTLTARAENHIVGRPDIKDTIRRLQAYQEAGADVLFAPGLATREDISAVVHSVDRPVNVLPPAGFNLSELSALGVRRVSVGSALARAALGAFMRAAKEMHEHGTFTFAEQAMPYGELNTLFSS